MVALRCSTIPPIRLSSAISYVMARLSEKGIKFLGSVTYREVTRNGLSFIRNGEKQALKADTIVLATGAQSDSGLALELKGKVPEVYCIGDAVEPRRIMDAIHEGFKLAYSL